MKHFIKKQWNLSTLFTDFLDQEYEDDEEFITNEAAGYSSTNTLPVFIILSLGHTPLSHIITKATGDSFSHATLSFDISLDPMYSFGTKKISPA